MHVHILLYTWYNMASCGVTSRYVRCYVMHTLCTSSPLYSTLNNLVPLEYMQTHTHTHTHTHTYTHMHTIPPHPIPLVTVILSCTTLSTLLPPFILLDSSCLTKHSNLVPLSDTLTLCRVRTYTTTPLVIVELVQVYLSLVFARDCRVPSLSFTAILGWTGICTRVHFICTSSPIRAGCGPSDVLTLLGFSVPVE